MSNQRISRRKFLTTAGITLAAAAVTCAGAGFFAIQPPALDQPDNTFGKENTMNKLILVTYATRAGSTSEVAAAIAEALSKRGYSVDLKPVKSKPSLEGYQAVVMGSAIRMGSWLPEMMDFIKKNQPALSALPTALFTMHMLNTADDDKSREARTAYTAPVHAQMAPSAEAFFSGTMDYARLSFLDRLIAKAVEGQTGSATGDHGDWNKINAWAAEILA
jgi:menaquinone-dependent protoporphyrinogen oxidase